MAVGDSPSPRTSTTSRLLGEMLRSSGNCAVAGSADRLCRVTTHPSRQWYSMASTRGSPTGSVRHWPQPNSGHSRRTRIVFVTQACSESGWCRWADTLTAW